MNRGLNSFLLLLFLLLNFKLSGQTPPDSIYQQSTQSNWPIPGKAARWAMVLPGAGQFYNKSYWKIPIVYAALGTCVFFIADNNQEMNRYRTALQLRRSGRVDPYKGLYSEAALMALRDYYRQNRDLATVFFAAAYALNIIDAYVDAHLKHFSVSGKLSMHLRSDGVLLTFALR